MIREQSCSTYLLNVMYFQRTLFIFEFILRPSLSATFFNIWRISVSMANVILDFLFFPEEEEVFLLLRVRVCHNDCFSSCPSSFHIFRSIVFVECKGIGGKKCSIFIKNYKVLFFFFLFWFWIDGMNLRVDRRGWPFDFSLGMCCKYPVDSWHCKRLLMGAYSWYRFIWYETPYGIYRH